MQQLTPEGLRIINELAQHHCFSHDAINHMLVAVLNGNGTMAQFNHPEFAGSGQWMHGGMIMLSDMFNNSLKARIDALCQAISGILAKQPNLLQNTGSFQSQNQNGGVQYQSNGMFPGQSNLFVPDPRDTWWPSELGLPNATGTQNNVRYAYFSNIRRLAVKTDDNVWVYDTQDHQISGFSQQQGMDSSIVFTSQYGTVNLLSLTVVSRNGQAVVISKSALEPTIHTTVQQSSNSNNYQVTDIFTAIERLGYLKDKGILTEAEFMTKKAELLSRL